MSRDKHKKVVLTKPDIVTGIDYGSSCVKVECCKLSNGKSVNFSLGSPQKTILSSTVRLRKGSWHSVPSTRGQQRQAGHRRPDARLGESSGADCITIRYSKRDIGRRFQEVDVQATSQEYGGLHIVENEDGYMALRLDGPGVANGFCITPLQIFEWYILEHILMKLAKDNAYTLRHLVLTVPAAATEDIKVLYEGAAKRALSALRSQPDGGQGLLHPTEDPEIHIISEPIAGMIDLLLPDDDDDVESEQQQEEDQGPQDKPVVYLGFDVGDGTTDATVVLKSSSGHLTVKASHGNSYLGAVDIKHAVLDSLPAEVLQSVPAGMEDIVREFVARAVEELSNTGDMSDTYTDFTQVLPHDVNSRSWLEENLKITRQMVHQAAKKFVPAFVQAIETCLEIAHQQPKDVSCIAVIGGGGRLPCVNEAISQVFGLQPHGYQMIPTQGGGSAQIAQGAAAYVLRLLRNRKRKQQGRPQEAAVDLPVGMHICTKITFRAHALDPKSPVPGYPINLDYLKMLQKCLAETDKDKRAVDEVLVQRCITAAGAAGGGAAMPRKLKELLKKRKSDFEVYLPVIMANETTPTAHEKITYYPAHAKQEKYSIMLYAADPLFSSFVYIGHKDVVLPRGSQDKDRRVKGEMWVDAGQRVQCTALLDGQQLAVETRFDRDAVQRSNRDKRWNTLRPDTLQFLGRLNWPGGKETAAAAAAAAAAGAEVLPGQQQPLEAAVNAAAGADGVAVQTGTHRHAAAAAVARDAAALSGQPKQRSFPVQQVQQRAVLQPVQLQQQDQQQHNVSNSTSRGATASPPAAAAAGAAAATNASTARIKRPRGNGASLAEAAAAAGRIAATEAAAAAAAARDTGRTRRKPAVPHRVTRLASPAAAAAPALVTAVSPATKATAAAAVDNRAEAADRAAGGRPLPPVQPPRSAGPKVSPGIGVAAAVIAELVAGKPAAARPGGLRSKSPSPGSNATHAAAAAAAGVTIKQEPSSSKKRRHGSRDTPSKRSRTAAAAAPPAAAAPEPDVIVIDDD